jgi:hypothetical protein
MPLAAALEPLSSLKQFIVCQVVPDPKPGAPWKTTKIPLAWRTFKAGDAHDPSNWLDARTAYVLASTNPTHRVGFVLTRNDPVWCLDIDNALQADNTWSPVARQLCDYFPGAAVELSDSRHGLHIWGCGTPPEHASKNGTHGIELYHEQRFIALGRDAQATGTVAIDWTPRLPGLVTAYFPPRAGLSAPAGAPDGPDPAWRGPTDDQELLRRALRSTSTKALFGKGASFADLWECKVSALANAFPSSTGDAFDRSNADAALASHLAFWTGRDAPRIERLMRQSALARPKWDERGEYYMNRTINEVCRTKTDILTDRLPEEVAQPVVPPEHEGPRARDVTGNTILSPEEQKGHFDGCVLIGNPLGVLCKGGMFRKPEAFAAHYGGFTFMTSADNSKSTRNAWEAFRDTQVLRHPKADYLTFRPDLPYGTILEKDFHSYANSYVPLATARRPGDASLFFTHMAKLFPNERDRMIVLAYMCAIVQHPGIKFQWAPFIQGVPGNGKTILSECVAFAVGDRYTHWPASDKLDAKFNGWMPGKVFYAVEDIKISESSAEATFEKMKPMITGQRLEIEGKGADQITLNICGNFLLNSNHHNGIRKTADDRRIAPFFTPQQSKEDLARDGMTHDYFADLQKWLRYQGGYEIVNELLSTLAIPDEFNPAIGGIAPLTSSTEEAIRSGWGAVEQEVLERIAQGAQGFSNDWVSSHYLDELLHDMHKANAIPQQRRRELMKTIGYVAHPGLPEGRVHNMVLPDRKRIRLYVKEGSSAAGLRGSNEIARAYTAAQLEVSHA